MTPTLTFTDLRPPPSPPRRLLSGLGEFDTVLGGGFVPGSTTLVAGDPGAGKSTLLLQIAARVADPPNLYNVAYVTAEETAAQVQARAHRLGIAQSPVRLAATNDVTAALTALAPPPIVPSLAPALVIFDSIQTLQIPSILAPPGSLNQALASLRAIVAFAHRTSAAVVVVCHVTKGGRAAGPNTLQHEVDAVLYLDSNLNTHYRTLRATKNRFGSTAEVGLFKMVEAGLVECPRS